MNEDTADDLFDILIRWLVAEKRKAEKEKQPEKARTLNEVLSKAESVNNGNH